MGNPKSKDSEIRFKEGIFRFASFREGLKALKDIELCSKEELLRFVSFYERFKRLTSLPRPNIEDLDYEKAELLDNLTYFFAIWMKILFGLTARGEIVELHTKPELMAKVILLAEGHPQNAYDPLPRGMISLTPYEWRERDLAEWDLDTTMAKLCRHLGVRREELVGEKPVQANQKATPAKEEKENAKRIGSINIQNFKGILGDVQQAENVQIGDYSSIQKQPKVEEKNKSTFIRVLQLLGWLWTQAK